MSGFDIAYKHVGDGAPCLIVAEVAQAHEGSLGMAHAYIDAIANAGADAVKFQCHIASAESTPHEPWRVTPKWDQDGSRYLYWKRMEFAPDQWEGLKKHANERGLIFLCSPFSVEAVRMLDPLVPAWKVPSGEITNTALLKAIAATKKPVFLSSGMATDDEATQAVYTLVMGMCEDNWDLPIGRVKQLFCRSIYPTPADRIGLDQYADEGWRGLSDHSGTIYAGLAAVTLGCDVLEVHVTFSRESYGFDVSSSITTQELKQLVEGVRFIEKAKTPVDKDAMARELQPMRDLFLDKHKRKAEFAWNE